MDQETKQQVIFPYKFEIENGGIYKVVGLLGTGGFGVVLKVVILASGEEVAIKVQDRQSMAFENDPDIREYKQKRVFREIFHHRQLTGHPCIIDFKKVFLTRSYLCIVMELAQGGTLFEHVADCYLKIQPLSEDEARAWFQQLILSQKFCHSQKIINRDIKLENTLRVCDPSGQKSGWWGIKNKLNIGDKSFWQLKICDFGYSKDLERNSLPQSRIGSLPYASPEVLYLKTGQTCDGYNQDVWACGVCLFILLTGQYPFDPQKYAVEELYERVRNAYFRFPRECKASKYVRQLVQRMLHANPATRITLDQVIQHPWFQVNLPSDWDKSFEEDIKRKQETLQSEKEIEDIVEKVFSDGFVATSVEDDPEKLVDELVEKNLH